MAVLKTAFGASLVGLLMAAPALADPMPRGAQPASAQAVAQAYAGKTEAWEENCDGGIYFAPNWQARAWCAESSDTLGAGKWSVDQSGNLCTNLKWFSPSGNSDAESDCIAHVTDRWGNLWRSWPGESDWWPMKGSEAFSRGYKFRAQVDSVRQQLGLRGG